jgi:hypothetical protein
MWVFSSRVGVPCFAVSPLEFSAPAVLLWAAAITGAVGFFSALLLPGDVESSALAVIHNTATEIAINIPTLVMLPGFLTRHLSRADPRARQICSSAFAEAHYSSGADLQPIAQSCLAVRPSMRAELCALFERRT